MLILINLLKGIFLVNIFNILSLPAAEKTESPGRKFCIYLFPFGVFILVLKAKHSSINHIRHLPFIGA